MEYNFYFKLLIFCLLLSPTFWLIRTYPDQDKFSVKKTHVCLTGLLLATFFVRFIYMEEIEANIDTSTWLSGMRAINHYPSWLWTLMNYTDSRPLTVLPLVIASWSGIPIGYIASECIGLIFWLLTIFFFFKICLLFLTTAETLILTWGFCLLIATTFVTDYIAYNSEQLSILMLTAVTCAYFKYSDRPWSNALPSLFTGLILGSILYVKFQNVPMGLFISAAFLFEMIKEKQRKNLLVLITGGILPTLLINLYYLSKGKLMVFWNNYFWNYFYYSYTTQFSNVPLSDRFNPVRIVRFIYLYDDSKWYFYLISITIAIAILTTLKFSSPVTKRQRHFLLFFFLYNFVCLYAIVQSGNSFAHYKLYLWVPITVLTGIIISLCASHLRRLSLFFFLIGSTVIAGKNILMKKKTADEQFASLDQKIVDSIQRNSPEDKPVVIWGWRDQLYVRAKRPMGYRDAHTFHFALKSRLVPFWTEDFLQDIRANKPSVFVDVTEPAEYSTFAKILAPHHHIPQIKNYIGRYYSLIENIDGVRIYKRKSERN